MLATASSRVRSIHSTSCLDTCPRITQSESLGMLGSARKSGVEYLDVSIETLDWGEVGVAQLQTFMGCCRAHPTQSDAQIGTTEAKTWRRSCRRIRFEYTRVLV